MTRLNTVVIILDDHDPRSLEHMPYLDSEPYGNWIQFPRAIVSTPQCTPARFQMLTGRYASSTGIGNHDDTDIQNNGYDPLLLVPTALQRAGIQTCHVGLYPGGWPWGLATYVPPGWNRFIGKKHSGYHDFRLLETYTGLEADVFHTEYGTGFWGTADPGYATDELADRAADAVAELREPFFVQLAFTSPHSPSQPAPRHATLDVGDPADDRLPNFNEADISDKPTWLQSRYPNQHNQTAIDTLDAERVEVWRCLKSADEGIQLVMDALNARGILDRTVVIFLGDNGESYMDHRHTTKGAPYESNIRSLLRVRWPGATPRVSDALISTVDIAPTLCDLAGAKMPIAPDGMSFVPLLDGTLPDAQFREHLLVERFTESVGASFYGTNTFDCLLTADNLKFVHHVTDAEYELYDLTADPYELQNDIGNGDRGLTAKLAKLKASALYAGT